MPLDPEDKALFRQAVQGTRRLRDDRVEPERRPPGKKRPSQPAVEPLEQALPFTDLSESQVTATPVELAYRGNGLDERHWRRLRKGEIPVDAELDLHGLRVTQARNLLGEFLHQALTQQWRCLLIVHGRGFRSAGGRPVLKAHVNHWLRQWEEVLAFTSCPPQLGGQGAVLVWLRRRR